MRTQLNQVIAPAAAAQAPAPAKKPAAKPAAQAPAKKAPAPAPAPPAALSDESEPTDRTLVIQLPTAKEDDDWTALVDELDK